MLVCSAPKAMPLWRMLTGSLPGYVEHEELLLSVTVGLAGEDCVTKHTRYDSFSMPSEARLAASEECQRAERSLLGPLHQDNKPQAMLASPIIRCASRQPAVGVI